MENPNGSCSGGEDESVPLHEVCRACLVHCESRELRSIYKRGKICGQITRLSDMLSNCTHLPYLEEDGLPDHMCLKCINHVSKAFAFIQLCIKTDETLRQLHDTVTDKVDLYTPEEKPDVPETVVVVDIDDSNVVEPLRMKKEPETHFVIYTENGHEDAAPTTTTDSTDGSDQYYVSDTNAEREEMSYETEILDDEERSDEYEAATEEYEVINDEDVDVPEEILGDVQYTDAVKEEHVYSTTAAPKPKRKKRTDTQIDRPKGPPFQCPECHKSLSNFNSYKYHMQLHSDKTPFLCSQCGAGFKTRNAYDGHVITHAEVNPHTCDTCGKSYRQAASLRSHMLSHTGEKPFTCQICGKGMTQKSGYKKHMLTHTGDKPHRCDICGKFFRYSSNLIMHKRAHTNEKNHKCDECGKCFIGTEQLKRHKMVHSGIKPFQCEECLKCFNRKSSLQTHLAVHANRRLYECPICRKIYNQRPKLAAHVQNIHNSEYVEDEDELLDDDQVSLDEALEMDELEEEAEDDDSAETT